MRTVSKSVGGWLWLLIGMLALYFPVTGYWDRYRYFVRTVRYMPALLAHPAWLNYRNGVWILFGISCVISIAAALALWRYHRPVSVWLALAAVWLTGPLLPVMETALASHCLALDYVQAIKPFAIAIVTSAVVSLLWSGYLLRSVRVRQTYGLPN